MERVARVGDAVSSLWVLDDEGSEDRDGLETDLWGIDRRNDTVDH